MLQRRTSVARPAWPLALDATLAALLLVAGQLEVAHPNPSSGFVGTAARPVSAVAAALIVLPLTWRRRAPMTVLCATAAVLAVPHLFVDVSLPFVGGLVPLLMATFTASRVATERLGRLALLVPFAALAVLTLTVPHFDVASEYLFAVPVFLVVWGTGQALRRWENQSRRLQAALAELARTQEAHDRGGGPRGARPDRPGTARRHRAQRQRHAAAERIGAVVPAPIPDRAQAALRGDRVHRAAGHGRDAHPGRRPPAS